MIEPQLAGPKKIRAPGDPSEKLVNPVARLAGKRACEGFYKHPRLP